MAGQIPRHFIDDLLSRVDIVDVVQARVKLKKSGSNYSACCPFHSEKTPSFTVSQTKQFYHCFGCSAHGSAISFLMEHDGMHFVDAVESLAESAGLEVPRESGDNAVQRDLNKPLYQLMEQCAAFYTDTLKQHDNAIDYLKNRGLSGEIAKSFDLGYAPPGWDTLIKQFPGREDDLLKIGMLTKNDKGRVYDRFRERIMFPIRDRRGRIIAFGGRVLGNDEPKYLNSPETPLYHKGSELYALFQAQKTGRDAAQIIVVEGYMDVIALAQYGVDNAVATLGTATNQQHSQNIYRVAPEIVFCFDGDRAGRDAAWRALQATLPCLEDGREAYFLFLPDGQDPDSLVSEHGAAGFYAQLENKKPIIEFMFEHLAGDADLSQIGTRARLAGEAAPLLQTIPRGVYQQLAQQHLESMIGMSLNANTEPDMPPDIHYHDSAYPNVTPPRSAVTQERALTPMRRAVLLLLNYPALAQTIEPEQYNFDMEMPGAKLLMKLVTIADQNNGIRAAAMIERFREQPEWDVINKLSAIPYFPDARELEFEVAETEFVDCITTLNKNSAEREANKLPQSARTGLLGLGGHRRHKGGGDNND